MTELDEAPIILRAICEEKEGPVIRNVRPLTLGPENVKKFYEAASKFPTVFGVEVMHDFPTFCNLILQPGPDGIPIPNGLFWVIDDFVGIFYMNRIIPGVDACVHYTFFDQRQRGREELVREMLIYGFYRYDFRRLSVEVPVYSSPHTFFFVEKKLGFTREGRKRRAMDYKGKWFDVVLYGMLREEIIPLNASEKKEETNGSAEV